VRTNSESILAVTSGNPEQDFTKAVAITSSIYPDPDTHIEPVTYGQATTRIHCSQRWLCARAAIHAALLLPADRAAASTAVHGRLTNSRLVEAVDHPARDADV